MTQPGHVDAVVVGAGIAGLYALHRLTEAGLTVQGFEAGDGVGGTWYWNRYPGARCDVESVDYSYSFDDDLQQQWDWTERYAAQPELLRYLEHVADRFDLRRHIAFGTRVDAASFDAATGRWTVQTDAGTTTAQFLVLAVGCLSAAQVPDFPGLETFRGEVLHTGQWPAEGVDLAGRRVGVIGTGSSAIQAIPVIAEQAEQLVVFQRTPNYSVPAGNRPLSPDELAEVKAGYAEHRRRARNTFFGFAFPLSELSSRPALEVPAADRDREFQARWDRGGAGMTRAFADILTDRQANETAAEFIRSKIRATVTDPGTAELLVPVDHPFGTKRPPIDTNYYESFNRDNVTLVDVRSDPIVEVVPSGVRTGAASHDLDVLVLATGFDAMTGPLLRMDIRGVGGRELRDKWAAGPVTYLGLATEGFPNMFVVAGAGSPSVMSNMVVSIEQHVDWIVACLQHLRSEGHTLIEACADAEQAWVEHVNATAARTLYPEANSWYLGANVPGKPRVFMPYVGGIVDYRQRCEDVAARGYAGFRSS
ncbi:flavin-containing monooxygenase [Modestobacter versicolor]|uniref:Cyclohexanone monooxygenase n=1 Tax=Modestobacter versicolor TaxID=429133 RepID=A0A323VDX9_9ACTN|nr:NAD(P)/FAD-dependent oxidoreductase [Modestobacter versicolor]MBB3675839.1 cyclohexanone monooxygenase [Modestobacter versicolor]PZA22845.1 cyclohexanone monooxygenase [Modestobacter versicolor]